MKKSLSILLMTLIILLLAGCGGTDNDAEEAMTGAEEETTEQPAESVTTEEAAAGGAVNEERTGEVEEDSEADLAEEATEDSEEATTEEVTEEQMKDATKEKSKEETKEDSMGGSSASGPYEKHMVQNPAGESCIMNRLAADHCEDITMQQKFLAYHHLNFINILTISPNIGCLECMVDYSFAVIDGTQEPISINEMDTKGAPFTPNLETFMESYAYELANFFNGHPNRLMDYISQDGPAISYLDNNRTSGSFADHTTHSVDVQNIEDKGDGTYKVTMDREYEHITSNGIGSSTVEYTVCETEHAFKIVDFN
ncbi:hypothetical protein GCM10022378_07180 [Salinicoccus jeotgali]|uniref:Lipoprotein n=1 Tax=Salinicoccus jeotgali TaxID=381634 RepID=A0ABP7EIB6_9STAP